jgi:PIN domain nuclease of toxin-antitoxin system
MNSALESALLLDTHVWIWLNTGSAELSKASVSKIDAAAHSGHLLIPSIAVWEVATLVAKGRLSFRIPIDKWIDEALSKEGVELVPLLPSISIESASLPGDFHGDPADRLIVATARVQRILLMTRDEKILRYSKSGHVEAIKA